MSLPEISASGPVPAPRRLPPLLRRAWYGLNQSFRQRIAHLGITPDQYSILRWLKEGDPRGLTQSELTELMASDPNTITSTVSRMEAAGLVSRHPHETDRRARRVRIEKRGEVAYGEARGEAERLQAEVLEALPVRRREVFLEDLARVAAACGESAQRGGRRGN
jgi:DNA-binding MarR family transcriptional regulator